MTIKRNQQGIAHLYLIIVIVLVVVIGLVGWRVWEARKTEAPAPTASTTGDPEPAAAEETVNYVLPQGEGYRIGLPEGWVSSVCGADSPDALFMAPTTEGLGKCNSDSLGTVFVNRGDGNQGYGSDYYEADPMYGGVTYTPVTIDGVAGYKVAYTVATKQYIGPAIGDKITQYVLFDGNSTYTITYAQAAGQPDYSGLVETAAESFDKL